MKRGRGGNAKNGSGRRSNNKGNEKTQVTEKSDRGPIFSLPLCILVDIFLLLPSSSIAYCKCVCKLWYDLLSNPNFCTMYLRSPPYINLVLTHIMKTIPMCTTPEDPFGLIELPKRTHHDSSQIPISPKRIGLPRMEFLSIKGSCDGLLCLAQQITYHIPIIHISNPLMGEYITLPPLKPTWKIINSVYGFGFSSHYKILVIHTLKFASGELGVDGQIFTLGVDKNWRDIRSSVMISILKGGAVTVNGAFHWLVDPAYVHNCLSLVPIHAFDIEEEKFRYIPPPPTDLRTSFNAGVILGNLQGRLCVFDYLRAQFQLEIWVMKYYGVAQSWNRHYLLKTMIPSVGFSRKDAPLPIQFWRDAEMLIYNQGSNPHLLSYDLRNRKSRVIRVSCFENDASKNMPAEITAFLPSLVPLKKVVNGPTLEVFKV